MSLPGLTNGVLDLFYGGGVSLRDQILKRENEWPGLYSHRTAAFFIPQLFVNGNRIREDKPSTSPSLEALSSPGLPALKWNPSEHYLGLSPPRLPF